MLAIGQFTEPQNTAIIPIAAAKEAGSPIRAPKQHPKVAPIIRAGNTPPPLYPDCNVIPVRMSFKRKS